MIDEILSERQLCAEVCREESLRDIDQLWKIKTTDFISSSSIARKLSVVMQVLEWSIK